MCCKRRAARIQTKGCGNEVASMSNQGMHQFDSQKTCCAENASLLCLLLAFFAPVYYRHGNFELKTAMVSSYAGIYIKRNSIATLITSSCGLLLIKAEYAIPGTVITGCFVVFASLCVVFLAAIYDKKR